jgi:predicted Zn-dependent protease with MMP-like domain
VSPPGSLTLRSVHAGPRRTPLRRRDRHGRGVRGPLVADRVDVGGRQVPVPLARSRGERFDGLVLDVLEHLELRWGRELSGVEVAVEDVPVLREGGDPALDEDAVVEQTAGGAVPLGRLLRGGVDARGAQAPPRVVVYRRPLEARAADRSELAEIVHDVVVDVIALLLDLDPDEVDPPRD